MSFNIDDLIFKPLYPLSFMIPYAIIMVVIVLLNRKNIINRILIILLSVLISQRPMLKNQEQIAFNMDLDILFVIDNTVSMHAIDVNGMTRLEAVKKDCAMIMDEFAGANYGIITYANLAQVKYPFTNDNAIIADVIDRMKIIDPNRATGSSLDLPYDFMKLLLESSRSKQKHKTVVFFMGDGELTKEMQNETNLSKYADLKDLIDSGAVLGYGSLEGAKVKITESVVFDKLVDNEGFLLDGSTNPPKNAISKINENNLKELSKNLGLDYFHMTESSVLQNKMHEIRDKANYDENDEEKMDKDIYYYFSGALIVLLLIELFHYRRNEQ